MKKHLFAVIFVILVLVIAGLGFIAVKSHISDFRSGKSDLTAMKEHEFEKDIFDWKSDLDRLREMDGRILVDGTTASPWLLSVLLPEKYVLPSETFLGIRTIRNERVSVSQGAFRTKPFTVTFRGREMTFPEAPGSISSVVFYGESSGSVPVRVVVKWETPVEWNVRKWGSALKGFEMSAVRMRDEKKDEYEYFLTFGNGVARISMTGRRVSAVELDMKTSMWFSLGDMDARIGRMILDYLGKPVVFGDWKFRSSDSISDIWGEKVQKIGNSSIYDLAGWSTKTQSEAFEKTLLAWRSVPVRLTLWFSDGEWNGGAGSEILSWFGLPPETEIGDDKPVSFDKDGVSLYAERIDKTAIHARIEDSKARNWVTAFERIGESETVDLVRKTLLQTIKEKKASADNPGKEK